MTRSTFICLCAIVLGLAARASAQSAPPREGGLGLVDQALLAAGSPAPPLLAQGRSPAPQTPPVRRRRGTFVGYIDDALPESNLRVRFDAAGGNTAPDRAEFFYAKCGCYRGLPAAHPGFDPDAPGPGPGAASDLKFQQLYLEGEFEIVPQLSVLGQIPLRWLQPKAFIPGTGPEFSDQSGLGDIRVGAKLAFVDTPATTASVKVQFYFPSGDASKGLGTDHASWEPAVLLWNELSPRVNLESQLGVWLPVGGAAPVPTAADGHFAGRVFYYGIGPSFTVYDSGRTRIAPVVELVGWRVMKGNLTPEDLTNFDASGTNIVNLKFGARFVVDRGSFYVGYGHALTDAAWYTDIVRFEYRYGF
ncbi:MAG TPA: transporter [Vicinamibacterales bacterium]|nr:transporter [Vicinamibacterales bacterium]